MNDFSTDIKSSKISSFALDYAIISDIGKRRTENQDSFARTRSVKSNLFVVADGMGGARGGSTASTIAVNIVGRKAYTADGIITPESLKKALELANYVVHAFGTRDEELAGMGTTVVALAITDNEMVMGFVGDSRVYILQENVISQLSRDHTLVQELIDSGALAEEEAVNHPISHMLTRSLGPLSSVNVEAMLLSRTVTPGDTILLCSDGLYHLVTDEEIKKILGQFSPQEAAQELVDLANERGGSDNITVEVIRVLPEIEQIDTENVTTGIIEQQYSTTADDLKIQIDFDRIDATLAKIIQQPQIVFTIADDGINFPGLDDAEQQDKKKVDDVEGTFQLNTEESPQSSEGDKKDKTLDQQANSNDNTAKEDTDDGSSAVDQNINKLLGFVLGKNLKKIALGGAIFASLAVLAVFIVNTNSGTDYKSKNDVGKSFNSAQFGVVSSNDLITKGPEGTTDKTGHISYTPPELLVPEDLKINNEELQKINNIIAHSSDFFIPESPSVKIGNSEMSDKNIQIQEMQPISWEEERENINVLQSQPVTTTVNSNVNVQIKEGNISAEEKRAINALQPEELGISEKKQIAARKQALRERVFDIDAKLKVFSFRDSDERDKVRIELEKTVQDINDAIEYKIIEKAFVLKVYNEFLNYQKQIKEKGFEGFPALAKVIAQSRELITSYEAFNASSSEYQKSLEIWKKKPKNQALSAKTIAKGNEIRTTHNKLKNAIDEFINREISNKMQSYFSICQQIQDLVRRRDRINRHIGFVIAFSPNLVLNQRMTIQRDLLDNRRLLEKEYSVLSEQLPDNEEKILVDETVRSNNIIPE